MFGDIEILEQSLNETTLRIKRKCESIDDILATIENNYEQKNYEFKNQSTIEIQNMNILNEAQMFGNMISNLKNYNDIYKNQLSNANFLQLEKKKLNDQMKKLGKHFKIIKDIQGMEVISEIKDLIREKNFKEIPSKIK